MGLLAWRRKRKAAAQSAACLSISRAQGRGSQNDCARCPLGAATVAVKNAALVLFLGLNLLLLLHRRLFTHLPVIETLEVDGWPVARSYRRCAILSIIARLPGSLMVRATATQSAANRLNSSERSGIVPTHATHDPDPSVR